MFCQLTSLVFWRLRTIYQQVFFFLSYAFLCDSHRTTIQSHLVFHCLCAYMSCGVPVNLCAIRRCNKFRCAICFSKISFLRLSSVRFVDNLCMLSCSLSGSLSDNSIVSVLFALLFPCFPFGCLLAFSYLIRLSRLIGAVVP
jgi:hypothetical protein